MPQTIRQPDALARSAALWIFGLCTTLLLLGLWGRSVTTDQTTLEDSARAVLESELVDRRLEDWLSDAMADLGAMSPTDTEALITSVLESPESDRAVDSLVDATVEAALAPPGESAGLDLSPAIDELRPAIDRAIQQQGLPIGVEGFTDRLGDLTLSSSQLQYASGTVADTRLFLSKVVLIASIGMVATGAIAMYLSDRRLDQLRSLCWRVAMSGFTFALLFRLGAWAVDPGGGRSPIASGSSVILRSNLHVPLIVALLAVVTAGSFMVFRRQHRVEGPDEDTTGEQRVLVGTR